MRRLLTGLVLCGVLAVPSPSLEAQSSGLVKVTPLGSHAGELCSSDRALLFEDPSGVRILYDPGNTTDETDARLGDVHAILLSHGHGDHTGQGRINRSSPGTCAAPVVSAASPNTNIAAIASLKNAMVVIPGLELMGWMATKIQAVRGSAVGGCATGGLGNATDVPAAAPCVAILQREGSRSIHRAGQPNSVRVIAVQAIHGSNVAPAFIDAPGLPSGLTGYGGPAAGFVVQFTNGLTAYLTGDTGLFGDMQTIVSNFYKPNMAVVNMGDIFSMGPEEALFMIRNLQRPVTVLPSHVNEAATSGGSARPGTKTDLFARPASKIVDVVIPVSNTTLSFDGTGQCVGCRRQ